MKVSKLFIAVFIAAMCWGQAVLAKNKEIDIALMTNKQVESAINEAQIGDTITLVGSNRFTYGFNLNIPRGVTVIWSAKAPNISITVLGYGKFITASGSSSGKITGASAIPVAILVAIPEDITAEKAADEANKNVGFETSVLTSWFPLAKLDGNIGDYKNNFSPDLNYNLGAFNFGLSATMGLNVFKDYGAYFDLKIGDPAFQKAVDILGMLNIHWVFLKFDYHTFKGELSWKGSLNPIPEDKRDFQSKWTTFSIMADLVKLFKIDEEMDMSEDGFNGIFAIGGFYGTLDLPIEYRVNYSNHGFGMMDSKIYGASFILSAKDYFLFSKNYGTKPGIGLYFFTNILLGGGNFDYDKEIIKNIEISNDLLEGTISTDKCGNMLLRLDGALAVTFTWKIGRMYAGFDAGLNLLMDYVLPGNENDDNEDSKTYIESDLRMVNFGPALRFHLKI